MVEVVEMVKTFVLHVKRGYEDRLTRVHRMLVGLNIEYELMLDGDVEDIDGRILDHYFSKDLYAPIPATSCALKHLLIYRKIVEENIDMALVLEDDISFTKRFGEVMAGVLRERAADKEPFYVGLEASCLRLIPRSRRKPGVVTYTADYVQCTGAYVINQAAARTILNFVSVHKCDTSFDIFLNRLQNDGLFRLYWTFPPVAEQGSLNGTMESSVSGVVGGATLTKRIKRRLTLCYKWVLYYFR